METPAQIDIKKFLPHREPMLMVDTIIALAEDKVTTTFRIEPDNIFVEAGKFTSVGLIENAAQTCSAIVGKDYFEEDDVDGTGTKLIGFISGIKKVEVHKLPEVNTEIVTKSVLISGFEAEGYSICSMECKSYLNEELLVSCVMNLFIQEII